MFTKAKEEQEKPYYNDIHNAINLIVIANTHSQNIEIRAQTQLPICKVETEQQKPILSLPWKEFENKVRSH